MCRELTHASLSDANFSFHRGAEVMRLPVVSADGGSGVPMYIRYRLIKSNNLLLEDNKIFPLYIRPAG